MCEQLSTEQLKSALLVVRAIVVDIERQARQTLFAKLALEVVRVVTHTARVDALAENGLLALGAQQAQHLRRQSVTRARTYLSAQPHTYLVVVLLAIDAALMLEEGTLHGVRPSAITHTHIHTRARVYTAHLQRGLAHLATEVLRVIAHAKCVDALANDGFTAFSALDSKSVCTQSATPLKPTTASV